MEIGSDFAFDLSILRSNSKEWSLFSQFPRDSAVFTDSGRTALRLGLRQLGLQPGDRLIVPAYVCDSILSAIRAERVVPVFRGLDAQFNVQSGDYDHSNHDAFLLLDFFGFRARHCESMARCLLSRGHRVLRDISHSMLAPLERIHDRNCVYVASMRKSLPLPDGGLVLSAGSVSALEKSLCQSEPPHALLRSTAMLMKAVHLARPGETEIPFRDRFLESERMLDADRQCYGLSSVSRSLVPRLDIELMATARRRNSELLSSMSGNWPPEVEPVFTRLEDGDVPVGFPIYCTERDVLQRFLIERFIYAPVHWPLNDEIVQQHPVSEYINRRILTIPCDHRYGPDDMKRVSKALVEWGMLV